MNFFWRWGNLQEIWDCHGWFSYFIQSVTPVIYLLQRFKIFTITLQTCCPSVTSTDLLISGIPGRRAPESRTGALVHTRPFLVVRDRQDRSLWNSHIFYSSVSHFGEQLADQPISHSDISPYHQSCRLTPQFE